METNIKNPPLQVWFFYGKNCSICHDLYPKVKRLIDAEFPEIQLLHLDAANHQELAAQNCLLSVPGLLFWVEGREHFRANGFLRMEELRQKLKPAYEAYYQ